MNMKRNSWRKRNQIQDSHWKMMRTLNFSMLQEKWTIMIYTKEIKGVIHKETLEEPLSQVRHIINTKWMRRKNFKKRKNLG